MMRPRAASVGPALIGAALLVVVIALAGRRSMVGPVVVLGFLMFAPGAAFVRLVGFARHPAGARRVVVVGASFAIDVVVTEAMVYARIWTPVRGLVVVSVLVGVLVAAERILAARSARRALGTRQNS